MRNEFHIETFARVSLPGRGKMDVLNRCHTMAIAAGIGSLVAGAVVGTLAIRGAIKGPTKAALPTTARKRLNSLRDNLIPDKEKAVLKAGNATKANKLQGELQDLRDEATILEKQLADQHELANEGLSGKDTASQSGTSAGAAGMSNQTKLLLAVGGVAVAGGVVLYAATRRKRS
jgi:hypothetical protein